MEAKQISKKKASIVNLLFNYANAIFAIINGLVLVPMYLRYFSVGTYGSFLSSGNIVAMLGLLEGGTSLVLTQRLSGSYAKKDLNTFSNQMGAGLFISISLTGLLILVGLGLFPFIADWVKAEPKEYKHLQYAFLLSAIGAGLSITFNNISAVFQSWLKVHISGATNLISILLGVASTLLGLKLGLGVVSIPLGILVRSFFGVTVLSISLLIILKKENYPPIRIGKLHCIELMKSALPVLGGNIAKSLVTNSQLLIITQFINPTASAVFFITGRIYLVCDSFLAPIGSSIFSSISQIVGEGNIDKIKRNLTSIFILFSAFAAVILSSSFVLNKAFISILLGPDKFGGVALSAFLCVNMFLNTRFDFLNFNLFALGIFGKTVLYDQIAAAVRILLIFTLIRYIGYIAVPVAEFSSTILLIGYFINKLILNRLGMKGGEAVRFVLSGYRSVLIAAGTAVIWYLCVPAAMHWYSFVAQATVYAVINGGIIFSSTKEARALIHNLFTHLKERYVSWI